MQNWKLGVVGLGLGLMAFASGCGGPSPIAGTGGTGGTGGTAGNLNAAVAFDDGDRLLLSDDRLDISFDAGTTVTVTPNRAFVLDQLVFVTATAGGVTTTTKATDAGGKIITRPGGEKVLLANEFSRNGEIALVLGSVTISLEAPIPADLQGMGGEPGTPGYSGRTFHCISSREGCKDDYPNAPMSFDYYLRTPDGVDNAPDQNGNVLVDGQALDPEDEEEGGALTADGFMTRFAVLKTTRSGDYIAFGTAVTMKFVENMTVTTDTYGYNPINRAYTPVPHPVGRYRPEQTGAFVSGPRYDLREDLLPQNIDVAYLGFANAYAQSSNRNFLPFVSKTVTPAAGYHQDRSGGFTPSDGDYADFGSGFAAMVLRFDDAGARFLHGYMDLAGYAWSDNGRNVQRNAGTDGRSTRDNMEIDQRFDTELLNSFVIDWNGDIVSPEYLDEDFAVARSTVDLSDYPQARSGKYQYEENPHHDVYLGRHGNANEVHGSGLAFRLEPDTSTPEPLDFKMVLVSLNLDGKDGVNGPSGRTFPSCFAGDDGVSCFASSNSPTGSGLTRLYGSPVTDLTNNPAAYGAPTFVAGVWRFDDLIYVDTSDNDPNDPVSIDNDALVGIVDLIGTIGFIIQDIDPY